MTKVVQLSATSLDLSGTPSNAAAPSAAPAVKAEPPPIEKAADFRLVIEEDPSSGVFIYKTLDRRTGEVVNQFPREQVLRMKDSPTYVPGVVFDGDI